MVLAPAGFGGIDASGATGYNFFTRYLGYIQSDLPDISIRLAEMDEAGRDKKVHEFIQIKRLDPIFV